MSVSVNIRLGGGDSMDIDRPTHQSYADSLAESYRNCAVILRVIADDIDRMYPLDAPDAS